MPRYFVIFIKIYYLILYRQNFIEKMREKNENKQNSKTKDEKEVELWHMIMSNYERRTTD